MISIIVATDLNGGIGYKKGGLPWKIISEHEHYRSIVRGKILLMSRKNFELSHYKDLDDKVLIMSKTKTIDDFKGYSQVLDVFSSVEEFLNSKYSKEDIFCLGGSEIYTEVLPHTQFLHLSIIEAETDAEVFFSGWKNYSWETLNQKRVSNESESYSWSYSLLEKVPSGTVF